MTNARPTRPAGWRHRDSQKPRSKRIAPPKEKINKYQQVTPKLYYQQMNINEDK